MNIDAVLRENARVMRFGRVMNLVNNPGQLAWHIFGTPLADWETHVVTDEETDTVDAVLNKVLQVEMGRRARRAREKPEVLCVADGCQYRRDGGYYCTTCRRARMLFRTTDEPTRRAGVARLK